MNQKFWAKQAKLITDTSAILDTSGVLGGEGEEDANREIRTYNLENPYKIIASNSDTAWQWNEQHFILFAKSFFLDFPAFDPDILVQQTEQNRIASVITEVTRQRSFCFIGTETRKDMKRILKISKSKGSSVTYNGKTYSGQEVFFLLYYSTDRELRIDYENDEDDFENMFFGHFVGSTAEIQIPGISSLLMLTERRLGQFPNRTYVGWGHTHLFASLAFRAKEGKISPESFNRWKQDWAMAMPTPGSGLAGSALDFEPILPNLRARLTGNTNMIRGGNLSLLVAEEAYTFYRTRLVEYDPTASAYTRSLIFPEIKKGDKLDFFRLKDGHFIRSSQLLSIL